MAPAVWATNENVYSKLFLKRFYTRLALPGDGGPRPKRIRDVYTYTFTAIVTVSFTFTRYEIVSGASADWKPSIGRERS